MNSMSYHVQYLLDQINYSHILTHGSPLTFSMHFSSTLSNLTDTRLVLYEPR